MHGACATDSDILIEPTSSNPPRLFIKTVSVSTHSPGVQCWSTSVTRMHAQMRKELAVGDPAVRSAGGVLGTESEGCDRRAGRGTASCGEPPSAREGTPGGEAGIEWIWAPGDRAMDTVNMDDGVLEVSPTRDGDVANMGGTSDGVSCSACRAPGR